MSHQPVDADLPARTRELAARLLARGGWLVTAESCTGGGIAAACTDLAGSSQWFERGFVTYSNAAKVELLGVPSALIEAHGAVSEPVARAMAVGALARVPVATLAVAVTGIAGPAGGSDAKPVGSVWLAWARRAAEGVDCTARLHRFAGDRAAVRAAAVLAAVQGLLAQVSD